MLDAVKTLRCPPDAARAEGELAVMTRLLEWERLPH